ncbi:MAG: hydantoinase B/oxoprolinase family protein [Candidatus Neomarinimicrobiota bacterium]|nr:hydantoinase B/oxoprolinase family protein [Candidatus Neomarinimicrobiota bacterium]
MGREEHKKWFFAIDRGGTFTDVIGVDPDGKTVTLKLLSQSSEYADPAIEGVRRMLGVPDGDPIPPNRVSRIRMGTTVATNALLERKGTPIALFITKGFGDLLEIGNQARPKLFDLSVKKPDQLYTIVREVEERLDHEGNVVHPLNETSLRKDLEEVHHRGFTSVAIVLIHAWRNGEHESHIADIAREIGFSHISISHKIMPLIKIVGRGQTTVVDAYLSPILLEYIRSVRQLIGDIPLEFMQSSGGLTDAGTFTGKDAIMSGPAGGVIGAAAVAHLNGLDETIGFDMGGTSTDVSRFGGYFERVVEVETAGIQFQTPSLKINTVAAGGGSLLWFDGQKMRVGPESAGADPGPVCYGNNGHLALTDANLFLGRLLPEFFPKTFGSTHDQPLDNDAVSRSFDQLTKEINSALNTEFSATDVALGFVRIANETMASAIKEISVSRGFDVRTHALVCFGGAAAQHTCGIARILGIRKVVVHPLAGLLSAYGIAMGDQSRYALRSILEPYTVETMDKFEGRFNEMGPPLEEEIASTEIDRQGIETKKFFDLRPTGTDNFITIPVGSFDETTERFATLHRQLYGFAPTSDLELVNLRVEVTGKGHHFKEKRSTVSEAKLPELRSMSIVTFDEETCEVPVYHNDDLDPGFEIDGPAIIIEQFSTTVVEPGFSAVLNQYRHIVLTHKEVPEISMEPERDPIMLEVFNHLFMSIAEQMGHTLTNTAHSINIKERLDFSCAIFDPEGNLVANAPHMPVHLGAMSESVKEIIGVNRGAMKQGDAFLINNPHRGGSHLPDLTVIAPIFGETDQPIFYTASRGHHADIGGTTPGSMPPFAETIQEEGVVIDNFLLVKNGELRLTALHALLSSTDFPARNIDERIADIKAQIAAVNKGIIELERLIEKYGEETVHAYMGYIRENSAESMRAALEKYLADRASLNLTFQDHLDSGDSIIVRISLEKGDNPPHSCAAVVDFAGTSPQLRGNLNAPTAVTKAAVLYVFRLMIDEEIPLNSGCLEPIEIIIPKGCLLRPDDSAAVVGGNVETSQRITDVLMGALGLAGASQGTMNNFLFGAEDGSGKQYYETIAGGSGASEGHPGASAVQVHMTNTRATDPEVLEHRHPEIRLEQFSIRKGSGGDGLFKGGDGTVREIRFLEKRKISILSERRNYRPYGMEKGGAGMAGRNRLITSSGEAVTLEDKVERVVESGEKIIIETPGGGGFGDPTEKQVE